MKSELFVDPLDNSFEQGHDRSFEWNQPKPFKEEFSSTTTKPSEPFKQSRSPIDNNDNNSNDNNPNTYPFNNNFHGNQRKRPVSGDMLWRASPLAASKQEEEEEEEEEEDMEADFGSPTKSVAPAVTRELLARIEPQESLFVAKTYSKSLDPAVFLGRSFRASFGPNGLLVHSGQALGVSKETQEKRNVSTFSTVHVERLVTHNTQETPDFQRLLGSHFNGRNLQSAMETDNVKNSAVKWEFQNFDDHLEGILNVAPPKSPLHNMALMVEALWSKEYGHKMFLSYSGLYSSKDFFETIGRKFALDHVLMTVAKPALEFDAKNAGAGEKQTAQQQQQQLVLKNNDKNRDNDKEAHLEKLMQQVFIFLSGGQVEQAAELAMERGQFHLATLISQAAAIADPQFLAQQIFEWENEMPEINKADFRFRVMYTLAGQVKDICYDLDWKRAFLMHSLYFRETDSQQLAEPPVLPLDVSQLTSVYLGELVEKDEKSTVGPPAPLASFLEGLTAGNTLAPLRSFSKKPGLRVAVLEDHSLLLFRQQGRKIRRGEQQADDDDDETQHPLWLKRKDCGDWERVSTAPAVPVLSVVDVAVDALFSLVKIFASTATTSSKTFLPEWNPIHRGMLNTEQSRQAAVRHCLAPAAFSPFALDACASWHLYSLLSTVNDDLCIDWMSVQRLTLDYAAQLEAAGHWRWALYVLAQRLRVAPHTTPKAPIANTTTKTAFSSTTTGFSSTTPMHSRTGTRMTTTKEYSQELQDAAIKNVLWRHAHEFGDLESLAQLGIPVSWIWEAHGDYWLSRGDLQVACQSFIDAKLLSRAHSQISSPLPALMLLAGKREELAELISLFSILGSSNAAELLEEFFSISQDLVSALGSRTAFDSLASLDTQFEQSKSVLKNLGKSQTHSVEHYAVFMHMASTLVQKLLLSKQFLNSPTNPNKNLTTVSKFWEGSGWPLSAPPEESLLKDWPLTQEARISTAMDMNSDYLQFVLKQN